MSYRQERQRTQIDARIRRKGDNLLVDYQPGVTLDPDSAVVDELAATHRVLDQTGESLIGFGTMSGMTT